MKHMNVVISNDIPGELSNNVSCGSTVPTGYANNVPVQV